MLPLVPSADLVKVPLYSFLRLPSFDFLLFTPLMLFKRKKEKKKTMKLSRVVILVVSAVRHLRH